MTVIQAYAPTTNAEEVKIEQFCDYILELIPKKRCPFHHRRLECKTRKSKDPWSNRQVWPWSTKAGQKLTEFCQEALFQEHKRPVYAWILPYGQY